MRRFDSSWSRCSTSCASDRIHQRRPPIQPELRALIWRMSFENVLWGAPRHSRRVAELGFEVAQSSVAKYMARRRGPPSQGWSTFLRNQAPEIVAMDLFVPDPWF